ncbi:hypothetical protein M433DRAFT_140032 [Acidomyces richmondensis BFW]|nr:MAG: hypothetical protein FE78DRAFT_82244 [Acidomyces sp. 'richmondensis']KYG49517.1 hypothetical protein M433DRAFT_140032 [Acidomyces richmondensis BFW]
MSAHELLQQPDEVAMKVMRRAQVSKMTRALQDRLALANVKIQNGWEHMSLAAIEPQIEERMRRKRPASSNDTISDTASTTSSRLHSSSGLGSSPLTAPFYSDDFQHFQRSGSSPSKKRVRPLDMARMPSSGTTTGRRPRITTRHAWKKQNSLPESSPIAHTKHARFASNTVSTLSFISEGSTVPDSPPSPVQSEEDDADLPIHSFSMSASTRVTSSPPRTPPPPDRRLRKTQALNVAWSRTPKSGEEGADLLMYLATSPSPATARQPRQESKSIFQPPSTPPSKPTPLPSSHMTPGTTGMGFLNFGPTTPGTNFNFADFVNVTPSPAQGHWSRTPVAGRTPAGGKEARRKLNFDTLIPPTSSPVLTRSARSDGLGMELGGELVS